VLRQTWAVTYDAAYSMYRGSGRAQLATGCGPPLPVVEIRQRHLPRRGCTSQSRQPFLQPLPGLVLCGLRSTGRDACATRPEAIGV